MPAFVGFNTVNQFKKFTLTDFDLIKRDLANALNIQQGQIPGKPQYGTTIWSYLFESQTEDTINKVLDELARVIALDPRIYVFAARAFPQENGMLIELEVETIPGTSATILTLFFDTQSRTAIVS